MMDVIGIAASYYLYVDSDRYIMIMMKEMVGDHIWRLMTLMLVDNGGGNG